MKINKSILCALVGSMGMCAVGIFVYMVILPAIAFLLIAASSGSPLKLSNPGSIYHIIILSLAGGFIGWSVYQFRKRKG